MKLGKKLSSEFNKQEISLKSENLRQKMTKYQLKYSNDMCEFPFRYWVDHKASLATWPNGAFCPHKVSCIRPQHIGPSEEVDIVACHMSICSKI